MDPITDLMVPGTLAFLMFVVGAGLQPADFSRVVQQPRAVLVGTLLQPVVLPLLAGLLVLALRPEPHVAAGLLLVACCPAGAISNSYALIAGANPALSVTLTALGSALGVVTLPILVSVSFRLFAVGGSDVEIPVLAVIGQLALLVLLPIGLGIAARHHRPASRDGEKNLRRISLLLVLALVVLILWSERAWLSLGGSTVALAVAFTVTAAASGLVLGWLIRSPAPDRATLGLEFAVRNLPAALYVATTSLAQPRFAVFAVVFFVVQAPIVLLGARLYLRRAAPSEVSVTP